MKIRNICIIPLMLSLSSCCDKVDFKDFKDGIPTRIVQRGNDTYVVEQYSQINSTNGVGIITNWHNVLFDEVSEKSFGAQYNARCAAYNLLNSQRTSKVVEVLISLPENTNSVILEKGQ